MIAPDDGQPAYVAVIQDRGFTVHRTFAVLHSAIGTARRYAGKVFAMTYRKESRLVAGERMDVVVAVHGDRVWGRA